MSQSGADKRRCSRRWMAHEDDIICKKPFKECVTLLPHRTNSAIKARARSLGVYVPSYTHWAPWEDFVLTRNYPNYKYIETVLKARKLSALKTRAAYLGICRTVSKYSKEKVDLINDLSVKGLSPREMLSYIPGENTRNIRRILYLYCYNVSKENKAYEGPAIIKSIRKRCRHKAIYLSRLDSSVGSTYYFRSGRREFVLKYIVKAIEALDGELTIKWNEPRDAI